ncbi:hypothetical protein niasHS_016318 [Heterodera schachtii]|uniref:Uncharacterized protein n=1 Tax=Heterodera schachtii TaxID=97005 RepID=A0ABD2IEM6_HETSC
MDRIIILIPSVITAFLDRAKECGTRRRAKARYRAIGPALRARNRAHKRRLAEENDKYRAIGPALRARNRAHRRRLAEEKEKWVKNPKRIPEILINCPQRYIGAVQARHKATSPQRKLKGRTASSPKALSSTTLKKNECIRHHPSENVWTRKEISLPFAGKAQKIKDCGRTLAATDQGFAVDAGNVPQHDQRCEWSQRSAQKRTITGRRSKAVVPVYQFSATWKKFEICIAGSTRANTAVRNGDLHIVLKPKSRNSN